MIAKLGIGGTTACAKNAMAAAYSMALMLISSACFSAVAFTCGGGGCTLDALPKEDSSSAGGGDVNGTFWRWVRLAWS